MSKEEVVPYTINDELNRALRCSASEPSLDYITLRPMTIAPVTVFELRPGVEMQTVFSVQPAPKKQK